MKVRVPASIANLGPGFDVLAMAVDLWLVVEAEPADRGRWTLEGEGTRVPPELAALPMKGHLRNGIPIGVGLGSSAANRLAALALQDARNPAERVARLEGHRDNAWAAYHGGVVLLVDDLVATLPVPDLEVALFVAGQPARTEAARAVLPGQVAREDAVFNAAHLALLVDVFHTRRWGLLRDALGDRLHQPHRLHLYPYVAPVMEAARKLGWGAAVCGAGPSVFSLCEAGQGETVAQAMAAAAPGAGRPLVTRITRQGLAVEP